MEIAAKQDVCKDEASLKAGLEARLQGREAMEIWNKTLRGRLRGRPGAMEIGASQYISQRRGPFLVLKRQEKADAQTWASPVVDRNEVPKLGAQNRQFCGDAWAYLHSIFPFGALFCHPHLMIF